jgi:hypothetical protein
MADVSTIAVWHYEAEGKQESVFITEGQGRTIESTEQASRYASREVK